MPAPRCLSEPRPGEAGGWMAAELGRELPAVGSCCCCCAGVCGWETELREDAHPGRRSLEANTPACSTAHPDTLTDSTPEQAQHLRFTVAAPAAACWERQAGVSSKASLGAGATKGATRGATKGATRHVCCVVSPSVPEAAEEMDCALPGPEGWVLGAAGATKLSSH